MKSKLRRKFKISSLSESRYIRRETHVCRRKTWTASLKECPLLESLHVLSPWELARYSQKRSRRGHCFPEIKTKFQCWSQAVIQLDTHLSWGGWLRLLLFFRLFFVR